MCVCVCVRVLVCWSRKGSLSEQLIELSLLKQLRKLGLPDDPHGHGYVRMSCATGHAPHKHPMGILHCLILHKNVYIERERDSGTCTIKLNYMATLKCTLTYLQIYGTALNYSLFVMISYRFIAVWRMMIWQDIELIAQH